MAQNGPLQTCLALMKMREGERGRIEVHFGIVHKRRTSTCRTDSLQPNIGIQNGNVRENIISES